MCVPACSLSWALVHSHARADVAKGVDLAEAMLHSSSLEARDLQYLIAVGKYRSKKYLDARRILKEVLEVRSRGRSGGGGGGGGFTTEGR